MKNGVTELFPDRIPELLALRSPEGFFPIWQTGEWARFLLKSGWAERCFFVESKGIWGFFELRSVGLGKFGLFCVGGPVSAEGADRGDFSQKLRSLAMECGATFVQYEAVTEVDVPGFGPGEYRHFLEKRTLLLDLSGTEDEILSQMKEKGRYNIRLAEKRGVTVRMSDGNENDLAAFFALLSETLSRDGFSGNSLGYYREMLRMLQENDSGGLFVAEKDGEPVAAAIATFVGGTATYYYGASTSDNEKRRDMPAYALQWEMMREGKRRGCSVYDFLGIAPEGKADHPLSGVTDFKLKFGGEIRQWPESRIMVVRPWAYRALLLARRLKRILK